MPPYARIALLSVLALAAVTVLTGAQPQAAARTEPQAAPETPDTAPIAADSFRSERTYAAVAPPVRLRIPALHIDSRLANLGLMADGTIAVPKSPSVAGWFDRGPRPGQAGPAVILGHVDSHSGPGVFFDLSRVRPGAEVRVDRADGTAARFRVTRLARVPKVQFPTDLVYAPTLDPTLRLVTCGGSFDRSRGSYRDNVIAFADLV